MPRKKQNPAPEWGRNSLFKRVLKFLPWSAELRELRRQARVVRRFSQKGFGFENIPRKERWPDLDDEDLERWEGADLPTPGPHLPGAEGRAAEKQDDEETLNFPFFWKNAWETWRYLFDLSLVGELLACRPGDLVLDYAAGPCWVAEFFNRTGVGTVSMDVSPPMLERGRRRFLLDQRLGRAAKPHFVAADALALPFADETFDAVVGMNALHHLPSYRTALEEIFRVLKAGGRAAFSEPGAEHARSPVSQTRMREEGVLEKNVPLPLIYKLAGRIGFSGMIVVPLVQPDTYAFRYSVSRADYRALRKMWEDTLSLGPKERSCFLLEKGSPRPPDSRIPPRLFHPYRLRARIRPLRTQERVSKSKEFTDSLKVENTGGMTWIAASSGFGGQVTLGIKVCTEKGAVLRDDLGRTPIGRDWQPGETRIVEARIAADLEPGKYLLKYDMLVEGVAWFEQYGSTPFVRVLEVTE